MTRLGPMIRDEDGFLVVPGLGRVRSTDRELDEYAVILLGEHQLIKAGIAVGVSRRWPLITVGAKRRCIKCDVWCEFATWAYTWIDRRSPVAQLIARLMREAETQRDLTQSRDTESQR